LISSITPRPWSRLCVSRPPRPDIKSIYGKKTLVTRAAVTVVLGSLAIVFCYFFVDRPTAWFCHNHRFFPLEVLQWPPLISDRLKEAGWWPSFP